jgi:dTDP-4-amino-4,6-dideoxygalactose transaminase
MTELAIKGGQPVRATPYPAWPVWDHREREGLLAVLASGDWWATEGTKTRAFEAAWAAFCGTPGAAAVTNGTHAIELALSAIGVGEGDEVIVPAWSFLATASAVLMVNARPVFVDVDPQTGCIDVAAAEAAITERTSAIAAVHVAGHPADLDALGRLCAARRLLLVEDCAHAHGSTWNGAHVGSFGDAGTFSFQASKLMTAGEGGAVVSRRPEVMAEVHSYADCGRRPGEWFYSHYVLGGNYRMTEWQAAVLLAQLDRFPGQQARRDANARYLNDALAQIPGVEPQRRDPRCTSQGNYCYVVRIDEAVFGASREAVRLALGAEGIPLTMSYPPLHRLEAFLAPDGFAPRFRSRQGLADFASLGLPVVERLAAETLWFATAILMGDRSDCDDVVTALAKIQRHAGELEGLS